MPSGEQLLASGYANTQDAEMGINVALRYDGAASNNNLNILQDLYLFAVAYKGYYHDSTLITPAQALYAAGSTRDFTADWWPFGCRLPGRPVRNQYGHTAVYPHDRCAACNVVYAAQGADVCLTMVDGEVLTETGHTRPLIEKVKAGSGAYRCHPAQPVRRCADHDDEKK